MTNILVQGEMFANTVLDDFRDIEYRTFDHYFCDTMFTFKFHEMQLTSTRFGEV